MMNPDINTILGFLSDVAAHNTREWFAENRSRYEEARLLFERYVEEAIARIAMFDSTVAHVQVKECTYRFYRDTRFSEDKSPYKRHFGAYINACGRKAFHSGYYLHVEPGCCMLAGGAWCLPSSILKAVRQSIVDEIDEFRSIVEAPEFQACFPVIGESRLKRLPKGFASDFPYPQYLQPKDYSVCHRVEDDFFGSAGWLDEMERVFRIMKPYNDFVNYTIDDYE